MSQSLPRNHWTVHSSLSIIHMSRWHMVFLPSSFGSSVNILPINFPVLNTLSKLGVVIAGYVLWALRFYSLELYLQKLEPGSWRVSIFMSKHVSGASGIKKAGLGYFGKVWLDSQSLRVEGVNILGACPYLLRLIRLKIVFPGND